MSKPAAVLISDIHYSLANLELADNALRQAIKKANELEVVLIVAGDLHDTKANLRGECVNVMIKTFEKAIKRPIVLVGNHDKINEKSEEHSINFLDGTYAEVINAPTKTNRGFHLIPYFHDSAALCGYLRTIDRGSTCIMHQGVTGSNMGDYIQDKSAITANDASGLRVISGHYHARQTIKLPDGGTWDYIGNPYTVSYGEANDPDKGFQILMDDGTLEFVPTNLRKHVVYDMTIDIEEPICMANPGDLLWVKVRGSKEQLQSVSKSSITGRLGIIQAFRLDLIPTDVAPTTPKPNLSKSDIMDSLIDSLTNTSDDCKARLKDKWKSMT